MARHVFRYRSRFDGLPCSTDGRPTYSTRQISTVVPIASSLPVAVASHQYQHVQYVQQPTLLAPTATASAVRMQPYQQHPSSRSGYSHPQRQRQQVQDLQEYQYDAHGNLIPVAVAVAV
jgi:hypothetical protein